MHVTLLLVACVPILCSAGPHAGVVRSKSNRKPPRGLATHEDLTMGFNGAEDLPPVKAAKVNTAVSSSIVAKAGPLGPNFDHGDSSSEDQPLVVDSIPHNYQKNPVDADDSGSNIPMFLFLACGGGAVAWLYASEQKREGAKDKASAVMQLLEPMVRDAMTAIGEGVKLAGAANNAAVNLRAAGLRHSYQKVGQEEDELLDEEPEDPCTNPASGLDIDDEPEEVPTLVQQAAPLDLFTDNPPLEPSAPAPALLEFD